MKFFFVVIVALSTLSSCRKEEPATETPPIYLRMKVNGVDVNATTELSARLGDFSLFLSGEWTGGSLYIDVRDIGNSTGEFVIGPNSQTSPSFTYTDNVTSYHANNGGFFGNPGSGKLVVSELTKDHIKGTFEFVTAKNGITQLIKTVTAGEYSLTLQR